MTDSTDRLLAGALGALGRRVEARAAEMARYGERVGRNAYERIEDGRLISSLVVDGAKGTLVYELVGVSLRDLV